MSISKESDLIGMKNASEAVAVTLQEMINHAKVGMTTLELDEFGALVLEKFGAKSAPKLTYGFPGYTCISVNNEFCHGIPSARKLQDGDLINIDVSAELNGFWSDNGSSFVLGNDIHEHQKLVNASEQILFNAINSIRGGVLISDLGRLIETQAKQRGYKVIKNLGGHGIGRSLHESPDDLLNYSERSDRRRFKKNSVVAIETFISTLSTNVETATDGWTLVGNKGGFMAQHEHTIVITDGEPVVLTDLSALL
ncbi:MAG: type I methionyl aminopeptidase [Chitinophagaceae bacterium]|nr:MAG: type I methionyl aminopeptidase [Chitinophagaceae bacterium]